jgi:plastocyanin
MYRRCAQAVFLLVAAAIGGCGTSPGNAPRSAPSEVPAEAAAVAETQVVIDNFAFSPRELTVVPGTRVTWVNHDDVPHTATSTVRPRAFDSGALDTDKTFSFVFKNPGTYEYFCAVHPNMTGRVIVK